MNTTTDHATRHFPELGVTLIHGDTDVILASPDAPAFGAVVTDPPYGISYTHGGGKRGGLIQHNRGKKTRPIEGDDRPFDPSRFLSFPLVFWGSNYCPRNIPNTGGTWLVWDKTGGGRGPKDGFTDCEFAWTNAPKVKRNIFHYLWKGLVRQKAEEDRKSRMHPTQKPVALMRWCIELLKLPAGTAIIDPYMGCASTAVAAFRLGFPFVGIEKDREYFDMACQRMADLVAKLPSPATAGAGLVPALAGPVAQAA